MREAQPNRLRYRRQEDPEVSTLHEQDLAALRGRLRGHDDRVLVALGKDSIFPRFCRRIAAGRGNCHRDFEPMIGEAHLVGFFQDRLCEVVAIR